MTTAESLQLIVDCGTLISAFGAVVIGVRNAGKLHTVYLSLNSRLDQLLESSGKVAHAEGREEARKEEQERSSIELK